MHGCFGFKPTSVPAPCPPNPVPGRSRTSSVRAASYETKSKLKLTINKSPETERFAQLRTEKKHFIDTINLIAYRAESALAGEIREALAREDDGRALLRRLFVYARLHLSFIC